MYKKLETITIESNTILETWKRNTSFLSFLRSSKIPSIRLAKIQDSKRGRYREYRHENRVLLFLRAAIRIPLFSPFSRRFPMQRTKMSNSDPVYTPVSIPESRVQTSNALQAVNRLSDRNVSNANILCERGTVRGAFKRIRSSNSFHFSPFCSFQARVYRANWGIYFRYIYRGDKERSGERGQSKESFDEA